MSWAAHQFEYYAIEGHLPRRWRGKVSFLAIVAGDLSVDLVGKFWVYGFDVGGTHYGPDDPSLAHRGWPGEGFTHSLFWAFLLAGLVWLATRNRAWTIGTLLGAAAHAISDITDSVGTMLAFPASTRNFSIGMWAYAATPGGRNLDAAAYYSSLGLVWDLVWLAIALTGWRCLTTEHWRTQVVPADPGPWRWLGRRLPERALVTLYRSWFIYGVTRLVAWTLWAHVPGDHRFDLRWGGPDWIPKAGLADPEWVPALLAASLAIAITIGAVEVLVRAPDRWWHRRRGREPAPDRGDASATPRRGPP